MLSPSACGALVNAVGGWCEGALSCGDRFRASTSNSSASANFSSAVADVIGHASSEHFYLFNASGADATTFVSFSSCGYDSYGAHAEFDTFMRLVELPADNATDFVQIAWNDDGCRDGLWSDGANNTNLYGSVLNAWLPPGTAVLFVVEGYGDSFGTYELEVGCDTTSTAADDEAAAAAVSLPFACTFDEFGAAAPCGFAAADAASAAAWHFGMGQTPSPNTGPSYPDGGRAYIYVESQGRTYNLNDTFGLVSPTFARSTSDDEVGEFDALWVRFSYFMYGGQVGSLALSERSVSDSDDDAAWSEIWSLSGNQGEEWFYAGVALASTTMQIRFDVTTSGATTSDIAIDTVEIWPRAPTPAPSATPRPSAAPTSTPVPSADRGAPLVRFPSSESSPCSGGVDGSRSRWECTNANNIWAEGGSLYVAGDANHLRHTVPFETAVEHEIVVSAVINKDATSFHVLYFSCNPDHVVNNGDGYIYYGMDCTTAFIWYGDDIAILGDTGYDYKECPREGVYNVTIRISEMRSTWEVRARDLAVDRGVFGGTTGVVDNTRTTNRKHGAMQCSGGGARWC